LYANQEEYRKENPEKPPKTFNEEHLNRVIQELHKQAVEQKLKASKDESNKVFQEKIN